MTTRATPEAPDRSEIIWDAILDAPDYTVETAITHAFRRDPLDDPTKPAWRIDFAVCGWANRSGVHINPGEPFCPDCLAALAAPSAGESEPPTGKPKVPCAVCDGNGWLPADVHAERLEALAAPAPTGDAGLRAAALAMLDHIEARLVESSASYTVAGADGRVGWDAERRPYVTYTGGREDFAVIRAALQETNR